jgi:hypothetical protein
VGRHFNFRPGCLETLSPAVIEFVDFFWHICINGLKFDAFDVEFRASLVEYISDNRIFEGAKVKCRK